MPNLWHFVPWPEKDGQLTDFFRWLAHTHAMRWRVSHQTVGYGHLYQGRFKSFPVETDDAFLTICRYVERNALTAGLVERAEEWPWSSLRARFDGSDQLKSILCPWPVDAPRNWVDLVNQTITSKEMERVQTSIRRDRPFGEPSWVARIAKRLHLEDTLRPEGRPSKFPRKNNSAREKLARS
jgi:putative transposase